MALLLRTPYALRIRLASWFGATLARLLSRAPQQIDAAIADLMIDLPDHERRAIAVEVIRNSTRTQVELMSGASFERHAATSPISGPGLAALDDAHARRRPVLLLVSHFGNSAAMACALKARGILVGTYYKTLKDPVINQRYEASLRHFTDPIFAADRAGLVAMQRFLRGGGMVTISFDLDRSPGVILDFLGRPTRTSLSIAQMALRRDALMIPVYGIRQPDGLSFAVHIDDPIAVDEPAAMMQQANDSLTRMVRRYPAQWLWWHRRWRNAAEPDMPAEPDPVS